MRLLVTILSFAFVLVVANLDAAAQDPTMFTLGVQFYEHAPGRREPRVIARPQLMTMANQEFSITVSEVLPPGQAIDGKALQNDFSLVGVIRQLPEDRYELELNLTDAQTLKAGGDKPVIRRDEVELLTILRDHETTPKLPTGNATIIQISPTRWVEYVIRPYTSE